MMFIFLGEMVPSFQFHKGTIRTVDGSADIKATVTFQFHKGTIRTILR